MLDKRPFLLAILDGWGYAPPSKYNAVSSAKKPNLDKLFEKYPHSLINTSGEFVGLPEGVMGNSEVGHLNIGAGRVIWQSIKRIDRAIDKDGLASNEAIVSAINSAKNSGKKIHLFGLISDGAVHSMDRHYKALLRLTKKLGSEPTKVFLHCFLDGRDTPPQSGKGYVEEINNIMKEENLGSIASVMGRYYAMDRDNRWDRVKLAYDAMVMGEGYKTDDPIKAVTESYARNENDEFVKPTVIVKDDKPIGLIEDGDTVIFFNFRGDRAREITRSFTEDNFAQFERKEMSVNFVCLTEYQNTIKAAVAFPPMHYNEILGTVCQENGLKQLRIAETEKYAHVTFFFNGGEDTPFEGEDRILVPSPKVATYDLQPEMSAYEVTDKLVEAIKSDKYDIIILNFANCDMVGHTGFLEAAIKAVEAVDTCVGRVMDVLLPKGGRAIITADHGNAEQMWDETTNGPHTAHTTNKVPFVLVDDSNLNAKLRQDGALCDIVPTILNLIGIKEPPEMDGNSMII